MGVTKDVVRARIDRALKKSSEILANLGLTMSDFIRISLSKVIDDKGLPFDMYVPHAETLKTFEKSDKGRYVLLKISKICFVIWIFDISDHSLQSGF
ncbi:type II toxin-antitoxin system RelB/DinJ family antitoxin [Bartonella sp. AU18XJBT]|uniref:type II toxin-antitoxin system RelB/DinJ family antitoxin n=1 Tax=Bartonella sp. AU18XJBT TaxID=3019089 RepID=UPI002360298C|nr:type II toxin-antitoxin system RelB/DinJ family antitoxin [Bartonella sp. AU18XJBT]